MKLSADHPRHPFCRSAALGALAPVMASVLVGARCADEPAGADAEDHEVFELTEGAAARRATHASRISVWRHLVADEGVDFD
jgi:hypothetical protein